MKLKFWLITLACSVGAFLLSNSLKAQMLPAEEPTQEVKTIKIDNGAAKKGEWYFSWGYNKEWYTSSDLHVKQPGLGNNYTIEGLRAHDKPGWDHDFFKKDISIPQYNYRLGYFFKDNWAIEINFDHTKYNVMKNQLLHIKGTVNNQQVDEFIPNNEALYGAHRFIEYQLNNGANFLMFNIVHNIHLTNFNKKWFDLSFMWKAGPGIMIPHVENTIMGYANKPGFQFGGFGADVEGALRGSFGKYVYLEFANKAVGTYYYNLKVYDGKAKQTFGTYEMVLSLGVKLPKKAKHA